MWSYLSNPKPGHFCRVGAGGRAAGRRGGAGRGRTKRRRVVSSRRQPTLLPTRASRTNVLNDSAEARIHEIPCKSMEEQGPRLTCGVSAVYPRDEKRSLFLAVDQCTVACLSLYILFTQGVSEQIMIKRCQMRGVRYTMYVVRCQMGFWYINKMQGIRCQMSDIRCPISAARCTSSDTYVMKC